MNKLTSKSKELLNTFCQIRQVESTDTDLSCDYHGIDDFSKIKESHQDLAYYALKYFVYCISY